jgi:hypothetical protein
MMPLLTTPHWILEIDRDRAIVRVRRTAEPIASLDAFRTHIPAIRAALAGVDGARHGLLVDLRDGPMRSDPAFESAVRTLREEVFYGFARRATLVRTAVGRLQVTRVARESPAPAGSTAVFMDEAEALAWLAQTARRSPARSPTATPRR